MVEGYSVTEAASVLGVPTERVWELLARGVLSGAPDGGLGMRVFLQPRPAPPSIEVERTDAGPSPRHAEAESSPFRELLTEFRNLTERYGQALLALGESRGEVASLRSRVDLLEARIDLRLPMSEPAPAPAAPTWGTGQQPIQAIAPTAEPAAQPAPSSVAGGADLETERAPKRRRGRGHRRATDDFADALARAEDPSSAELPGAAEAGAAFAALREETSVADPGADTVSLPRELPAAEPISVLEPLHEPEPVPEPEPFPEPLPEPQPEALPEPEASAIQVEPIQAIEAEPEPVQAPEPEPLLDRPAAAGATGDAVDLPASVEGEAEPVVVGEPGGQLPEVEHAPWPERMAVAAAALEPAAETDATASGVREGTAEPEFDAPWNQDRYTSDIEEQDWIPEEPRSAHRAPAPQPEWPGELHDRPRTEADAGAGREESLEGPSSRPWLDEEPASTAASTPETEPGPSRDEETIGWLGGEGRRSTSETESDRPAAEMEVAGARSHPASATEAAPMPTGRSSNAPSFAGMAGSGGRPSSWPRQTSGTAAHVGPASRAYRRLRRIFPS